MEIVGSLVDPNFNQKPEFNKALTQYESLTLGIERSGNSRLGPWPMALLVRVLCILSGTSFRQMPGPKSWP